MKKFRQKEKKSDGQKALRGENKGETYQGLYLLHYLLLP